MFGIRYLKVPPTTYVRQIRKGTVVREGAGLSFFYFAPNTVMELVPAGSIDLPLLFEEASRDFQDVTVQGELTYRIADPAKIAGLLDFSVDAHLRANSDDPLKLDERLAHAVQIHARSFMQTRTLQEVLVASDAMMAHVIERLRETEVVVNLGIEIIGLSILSLKSTPEMAKALQADAREDLLRRADEAVFERRNQAVDLERKIKENELNTEIAVEEKCRTVRETKMQAEIAVEEQRAALVDSKVANEKKEAESRGQALEVILKPLQDVDWRTLLAVGGKIDSKQLIAMAFRDLADNASKIGQLNVSPDLLEALTSGPQETKGTRQKR